MFQAQFRSDHCPVVDPDRLPRHVAIICDGNGRWARDRGMPRLFGHHQGYQSVREAVRVSNDIGIEVLTLYAFSTENWTRPREETDGLMRLFIEGARRELRELHENNIRVLFSGRLDELPVGLRTELDRCRITHSNTGMTLNICLNYGGRDEILQATRRLVAMAARGEIGPEDVDESMFEQGLYTAGLPDPDLLIRTAGDIRLSNYLLWQMAYTEIHVTETRWPEFRREHLMAALADFQRRERRFGGVPTA
ncbi:MAG: polyprenyl diphosphate synthase [Armatimonadaceae bacterium]|jgi:undecaprenyl diphosphate synthase